MSASTNPRPPPPRRKRWRSNILNFLKFIASFVAILALVVFALSNRVLVPLGFWPFGSINVWLGLAMAGALGVGFLLGLLAHVPRHFVLHRRARNAERRLGQLTAAQDSATDDA